MQKKINKGRQIFDRTDQFNFRKISVTQDTVLEIYVLVEKRTGKVKEIYLRFIDIKKTYHNVV